MTKYSEPVVTRSVSGWGKRDVTGCWTSQGPFITVLWRITYYPELQARPGVHRQLDKLPYFILITVGQGAWTHWCLQKPHLLHLRGSVDTGYPGALCPEDSHPQDLWCLSHAWFGHFNTLQASQYLLESRDLPKIQNLSCPSVEERGQKEVSSWSKATLTNAPFPHLILNPF